MNLSRPSELMQFLDSLGARPKKRLSQNFLIDGNIVRKIVDTAAICPGDTILEIGSGPGVLTEELLKRDARVVAVEKDEVFAAALKRFPTVEVFTGDIRDFPLDQFFGGLEKKAQVVANLPYHLTTPILGLLAPRHDLFSSLTLMVQKEVGQRMTSLPSSSDYSALTVFLNFYTTPTYAFTVSNRCFYPAPKVQSAVIHLTLKKPPDVSPDAFFHFVHTTFRERRKMVSTTLKKLYPAGHIEKSLEALNLPPKIRPENLTVQQFLMLYRFLSSMEEGSSIDSQVHAQQ